MPGLTNYCALQIWNCWRSNLTILTTQSAALWPEPPCSDVHMLLWQNKISNFINVDNNKDSLYVLFASLWLCGRLVGNCNVASQDLLHLGGDNANGDDMILRAATPCTRRGRNKYSCKYREANMLLAACWNHQSQALASSICAFPLVLLTSH